MKYFDLYSSSNRLSKSLSFKIFNGMHIWKLFLIVPVKEINCPYMEVACGTNDYSTEKFQMS